MTLEVMLMDWQYISSFKCWITVIKNLIGNRKFFKQVLLSLSQEQMGNRSVGATTEAYRIEIEQRRRACLRFTDFTPTNIGDFKQIADYECARMEAGYLNSLANNFEKALRGVLNQLMNLKHLKQQFEENPANTNLNELDKKGLISQHIFLPARNFKEAVGLEKRQRPPNSNFGVFNRLWERMASFFDAYEENQVFERPEDGKRNVYWDVKCHSERPFKDYFRLARFSGNLSEFGMSKFQCMPLVTSLSPGYMQIDTTILRQQFLGYSSTHEINQLGISDMRVRKRHWEAVLNLSKECIKDQGRNNRDSNMKF
jgi:hypothetical protein